MASIELPEWLRINPTEHANKLIAGYGQGRAAGAGRLSAEEHEIDREYDATQRAEALAAQREQAAAMMAYRQQAQEEQSRQFDERQRMRQRQAEIAAQEASIQLEGQRGFDQDFQSLIEQGLSPTQAMSQAFPRHASKMLYKNQWRIPDAMQHSQRGSIPPVFGQSPGGSEYMQDPITGALRYAPESAQSFTPTEVTTPGGRHGVMTSRRHFQPDPLQPQGSLTQLEVKDLADISAQERAIRATLKRGGDDLDKETADSLNANLVELRRQREFIRQKSLGRGMGGRAGARKTLEAQIKPLGEIADAIMSKDGLVPVVVNGRHATIPRKSLEAAMKLDPNLKLDIEAANTRGMAESERMLGEAGVPGPDEELTTPLSGTDDDEEE